jgi:hypothetical protein
MNPWLAIPLEEYEGHMAWPSVAQSQYLAGALAFWARGLGARSVAVLGCAGGNGFDRLPRPQVRRVVGVDLNSAYIATARARHQHRFPALELHARDLLDPECTFDPVDLVFAGLLFEYVDVPAALERIRPMLKPGAVLGAILQLPSPIIAEVTPSPFKSMERLGGFMSLVDPEAFIAQAQASGYALKSRRHTTLDSGKAFEEFLLQ